ncbi:hypothetical protein HKD37_08G022128 [Glycine soja]
MRVHAALPLALKYYLRSYNPQFGPMKDRHMKKKVKRLKDMVEPDKNCETRVEDVAWLCSLSESEIDMLISLKLLIIQRAKMMGCKELASKFNLKMIRAIDACNLLKCSNEVDANIDDLSASLGADISDMQTFLRRHCLVRVLQLLFLLIMAFAGSYEDLSQYCLLLAIHFPAKNFGCLFCSRLFQCVSGHHLQLAAYFPAKNFSSSNIQTKEAESWKQRMKRLQLLEDLKHLAYPCDNTFT